jgi:hypothetical protein
LGKTAGGASQACETSVFLELMPTPLSESISTVLRADVTAALAALLVIAGAHRELYLWASHAICGDAPSAAQEPPSRRRPASRKPASNGGDRRLAKRGAGDEKLLEAMRVSPGASIGDLAAAIGKSRTSTVSSLHRLRDVGLTESSNGKWRLTEEPAPKEPPPRWTKPLSGAERAHQVHLTA